jgi:uncharacterized membrane protein YtjA (UPF0391 family)
MLYYTILFFLICVMAGVLGFGGPASTAAEISRVVFLAFLVLSATSLVLAFSRRRRSA